MSFGETPTVNKKETALGQSSEPINLEVTTQDTLKGLCWQVGDSRLYFFQNEDEMTGMQTLEMHYPRFDAEKAPEEQRLLSRMKVSLIFQAAMHSFFQHMQSLPESERPQLIVGRIPTNPEQDAMVDFINKQFGPLKTQVAADRSYTIVLEQALSNKTLQDTFAKGYRTAFKRGYVQPLNSEVGRNAV